MLATDIAPTRLARAKRDISTAVDNLQGGRVALLSFAGVSFTESPLTRDYNAFKQLLASTDQESVPIPGSNIELAVERAVKLLEGSQKVKTTNLRRRTLVIVSDGEELQGSFQAGAELLKQKGIDLVIFGIGTDNGAPVPPRDRDPLDFGASTTVVTSKLNREGLKQIATTSGAQLLFLDRNIVSNTASNLTKILLGNDSSKAGTNRAKVYTEYYQLPLLIGILLLAYVWRPALLALFLLLYTATDVRAADPESLGAQGKELLERGELKEAEKTFSAAQEAAATNDPRPLLGLGTALYRQGRFDEAAEKFAEAERRAEDPGLKALANFNMGNALLQADKTEEAITAYEQGLKISPRDTEIKRNLEIAKKIKKKKNPEQGDDKKEQEKSEEQQKSEKSDPEDNQSGEQGDKKDNQDQQSGSQDQMDQSNEQESKQNQEQKETVGKEKTGEESKKQVSQDSEQQKNQDGKAGDQQQMDAAKPEEARQDGEENNKGQQAVGADTQGSEQIDPQSQLIKSVTESRSALGKFREQEGEKILRSKGIPYPTQDW
jgi:Ca-activated chloride channel family protein